MIEGGSTLLDGWTVERSADAVAPVQAAARILEEHGATSVVADVSTGSCVLRIRPADADATTEVTLTRWTGERALRDALAVLGSEQRLAPSGAPLSAYVAMRLAGAAAGRRPAAVVDAAAAVRELLVALHAGGEPAPALVRCADGWVVARFRDAHERRLLRALTGPLQCCERARVVEQARIARLLVGSVEPAPASVPLGLGTGALGEHWPARRRPLRVVDWTVLWAGPWTAQQLRRDGAPVTRIEHPRRRDGLRSWPAGRRWWWQLNHGKRLALLDARATRERADLEAHIAGAGVLLTSMTPRALTSLGFDDDWRRARAPGLLHIELVAHEAPWEDAPGLGEHAAASAGLLWRAGRAPAAPYPWADPLLGAAALALARMWLATDRPGGRVRISLERAAALAFDQGGLTCASA